MATVVNYKPAIDYFSSPRIEPEDHVITQSSLPWDQTLYSDPSPLRSQFCDLMDISSGLSNPLSRSNSKYPNQTLSPSFQFGDFDSLTAGWDDFTGSTCSRVPEMDPLQLRTTQSLSNQQNDSKPPEDSFNDDSPFQSPQSLSETSDATPCDREYSTPLSWEQPELSYPFKNAAPFTLLSPEEESRLLAIAMPTQTPLLSSQLSPSPEPVDQHKSRKRKSSEASEFDSLYAPHGRHLLPHKSAHNMVEKRYRTNLNRKIALLRDSVPSMRVLDKDKSRGEDSKDDLQGLSPVKKLNKSTILTKAVEYIDLLIKQNKYLSKENQALKYKSVSSGCL